MSRVDLRKYVPAMYEESQEFMRFLDAVSDAMAEVRGDVLSLRNLNVPFLSPEVVLPHLLRNLGWSFGWSLSPGDMRKLGRFLRRLFRQRGTNPGIANMIRLMTGIECEVRNQERDPAWPPGSAEFYTLEIIPPRVLTPEEERVVGLCADYMKPAHTHWRILPPADHWELGISELDTQARLH